MSLAMYGYVLIKQYIIRKVCLNTLPVISSPLNNAVVSGQYSSIVALTLCSFWIAIKHAFLTQ